MEYNQIAVDAIEQFETVIRAAELDETLALHIGGILSAIELQIEEGKGKKEVVALLFTAIAELIKSCPHQEAVALRKAMAQCERVVMGNKKM